ncbi:MAG: cytochrome c oxidase subunit 3 [Myxococcales bacterium]
MTDILRYPSPRQREENTAWLGMLLFLGSWAMLFAGLFFAYGAVRSQIHQWPPAGLPKLPRLLPAGSTLVIALSSAALQSGYGRLRRGAPATAWLFSSFLLGTLFLGLQVLLWTQVWRSGLLPSRGPYPSVFWALTAFHALHVAIGVAALLVLAVRTARGIYNPARHLAVRLWAMYWHFVGAVWLLIFATVFVL